MTRGLHPETDVQRGEGAPPRQVETRDAPPGRVAIGVGLFLSLMLVGLGLSALLLWQLNRDHAPSAQAQARAPVEPPPPHLLAHPADERIRLDAAARARLTHGPVPIEKAMRDVVARGWNDAPAEPRR